MNFSQHLPVVSRISAPSYKGSGVVTDATALDNPILFATKGFYDFTGYAPDEVIGQNCRFLNGPKTDPVDVRRIRSAVETKTAIGLPVLNYKKDATPYFNHLLIRPVQGEGGKITRFAIYQNPVSERVAHYQALWNFTFEESLLADSLTGRFDLSEAADWFGVLRAKAREYFENILVKTGTTFGNEENFSAKIGTRRQTDLVHALMEVFEASESLSSSVRPNGIPDELVEHEPPIAGLPESRHLAAGVMTVGSGDRSRAARVSYQNRPVATGA